MQALRVQSGSVACGVRKACVPCSGLWGEGVLGRGHVSAARRVEGGLAELTCDPREHLGGELGKHARRAASEQGEPGAEESNRRTPAAASTPRASADWSASEPPPPLSQVQEGSDFEELPHKNEPTTSRMAGNSNPFAQALEPATELGRYRVLSPSCGLRVSPLCLGGVSPCVQAEEGGELTALPRRDVVWERVEQHDGRNDQGGHVQAARFLLRERRQLYRHW